LPLFVYSLLSPLYVSPQFPCSTLTRFKRRPTDELVWSRFLIVFLSLSR
jgi:hypothetical protein